MLDLFKGILLDSVGVCLSFHQHSLCLDFEICCWWWDLIIWKFVMCRSCSFSWPSSSRLVGFNVA